MIIIDNILKATEGFTLTNGEAFGQTITLSPIDSKDNWYEITNEEAMALQESEAIENE